MGNSVIGLTDMGVDQWIPSISIDYPITQYQPYHILTLTELVIFFKKINNFAGELLITGRGWHHGRLGSLYSDCYYYRLLLYNKLFNLKISFDDDPLMHINITLLII